MSIRTKLTKAELENKTKARCQLGYKAMKITNSFLERKGEKERKSRYAKLNRGR